MGGTCSTHGRDEKFWLETLEGKGHSEVLGIDGKLIGLNLREIGWESMDWTGCIWLRIGPVTGTCENDNYTLDSIKGGEILD
jgi:hypothetical protein